MEDACKEEDHGFCDRGPLSAGLGTPSGSSASLPPSFLSSSLHSSLIHHRLINLNQFDRLGFLKRGSFEVFFQRNERCASDPVLQPYLDQLQLHEEPLVSHGPLCHHGMPGIAKESDI